VVQLDVLSLLFVWRDWRKLSTNLRHDSWRVTRDTIQSPLNYNSEPLWFETTSSALIIPYECCSSALRIGYLSSSPIASSLVLNIVLGREQIPLLNNV
jgi:hypothetical protein